MKSNNPGTQMVRLGGEIPLTPAEEFERKRHYQNLKRDLFIAALEVVGVDDEGNADAAEVVAREMFRSITEERWRSEPVETPTE